MWYRDGQSHNASTYFSCSCTLKSSDLLFMHSNAHWITTPEGKTEDQLWSGALYWLPGLRFTWSTINTGPLSVCYSGWGLDRRLLSVVPWNSTASCSFISILLAVGVNFSITVCICCLLHIATCSMDDSCGRWRSLCAAACLSVCQSATSFPVENLRVTLSILELAGRGWTRSRWCLLKTPPNHNHMSSSLHIH